MDDSSLMPFGKHKGEKLINVPANYLLYLFENNLQEGKLKEYIKDNFQVIKQQAKKQ